MYAGWNWNSVSNTKVVDLVKKDSISLKRNTPDTVKTNADTQLIAKKKQTVLKQKSGADKTPSNTAASDNLLKRYLLFGSYCLLAAAAGFKFINMLINNVVKDKELNDRNAKIGELEKDKEKREKNSQISQQREEVKVRNDLTQNILANFQQEADVRPVGQRAEPIIILPVLPPVMHPEDPQKGRFGGSSERNFRALKAEVKKSYIPDFYNVTIWVESVDPQNYPLNADVVFYIHDSFSPSVYAIKPDEFTDGKALDDEILSFGAFTVGAIADNGKTLLELDLAEDQRFPRQFRER